MTDEKITTVPINITDNKDGTFTVEYEPKTPGVYTVQVFVSKEEVPVSPIKVKVETNYDISKVTVKGLDKRKFTHRQFRINVSLHIGNLQMLARVPLLIPLGIKTNPLLY